MRDTFHLPHKNGSWAITRFVANNPGLWLLHCHYAWHMSEGMGMFVAYSSFAVPPTPVGGPPKCETVDRRIFEDDDEHHDPSGLSGGQIVAIVGALLIAVAMVVVLVRRYRSNNSTVAVEHA